MNGRVMIVDDDRDMCEMLAVDLQRRGFHIDWRTSAEECLEILKRDEFDVIVIDLRLPEMDGIALCEHLGVNRPGTLLIVMTAFGSMEHAIAALRAGAYDFVTKPVDLDLLALRLQSAVKHRTLQEKVKILDQMVRQTHDIAEIIGESSCMQEMCSQIFRIADSEISVLVTGESGTGKELVARALHTRSQRRKGPFIAVNCSALPEALLESELFGHKRGSFTDAKTERKGLFQQAHGGTLFLDEIGDLPITLQPKLLRAIEDRCIRPIGGNSEIPVDIRIISATNRDLESAVELGSFREDLFYRLNVVQIAIPPLRARETDVLLLARHFFEQVAALSDKAVKGISKAAAEKLLEYSWPGNVRELRNVIERAVVLTNYDKIAVEDLPNKIRMYNSSQIVIDGHNPKELVSLAELERRYITHVMENVDGNKTLAARVLGIDRKTLYRKLKEYGVE